MFDSRNFHNKKTIEIMKIRAKLLNAARHWLNQHNYTEVQGPTIIPAIGDWPGHFEVKYFDKKAYLAQGLQPYANAFAASLGKIFTIAPTFRAEKLKTNRHLTEFWRIEIAQRCDFNEIMEAQEQLVAHICHSLASEAIEEFKHLKLDVENIEKVQTPFLRLSYDEAIDILQKDGFNISWGGIIDWELERNLSFRYNQPFFIKNFPVGIPTFFYKSHPKKPELTLSVDLFTPDGYGEVSGGGQMVQEKKVLLKKMAEENVHPSDQQWFINLMRYGSDPHSGFAIGLERLIQWICRLESITEASAFPRQPDNIYP